MLTVIRMRSGMLLPDLIPRRVSGFSPIGLFGHIAEVSKEFGDTGSAGVTVGYFGYDGISTSIRRRDSKSPSDYGCQMAYYF